MLGGLHSPSSASRTSCSPPATTAAVSAPRLSYPRARGRLSDTVDMSLLVKSFNPASVDGLMCRNTVSVGWDGALYDCDFNQMLEVPPCRRRRLPPA
jgi:hypothetical protein